MNVFTKILILTALFCLCSCDKKECKTKVISDVVFSRGWVTYYSEDGYTVSDRQSKERIVNKVGEKYCGEWIKE